MPEPGIYLTNSTGETIALATETGGGDKNLLAEALEENLSGAELNRLINRTADARDDDAQEDEDE